MFGLQLGRLGIAGSLWNERALWPQGASSPGLWIDPSYVASCFQDSAGTTSLSAIGTVLDSANPVGLILDRKAGATTLAGPGIHLQQATSAARPVASARVNLLTYSEDFTNANWNKTNCVLSVGAAGENTLTVTATAFTRVSQTVVAATASRTLQIELRAGSITSGAVGQYSVELGWGSSSTGVIVSGPGAISNIIGALFQVTGLSTTEKTKIVITRNDCGTTDTFAILYPNDSYSAPAGGTLHVSYPQINLGSTALPYQRVGAASDYDTSGFPVFAKLDGVDDSLASATFAAGTLTSSMDCLIAVRRDSVTSAVCGLYNAVADATKYFGMAESASSAAAVGTGAGTPTIWVDGTQLTGGTAVTRGTLHTALTVGSWHILELRGLDLSTWTATGIGNYTGYVLNGTNGAIQLFASGQDANRDKARARMAAYFGVTLA